MQVTLNNIKVEVDKGTTILDAAKKAGIKIPTLCHYEKCEAQGSCRVCVVEVEGQETLSAACTTPVANGMHIKTNTKQVRDARKTVVELLLSEHEGNCQICDRDGDCELQDAAKFVGIKEISFSGEKPKATLDESTEGIIRDTGKCIKCRRCVTVCNEVQSVGALFPQNRGYDTVIGPAFDSTLDMVACVQCGQCVAVCPVGALSEKSHIEQVFDALDDPTKHVVVQTAPAIRAALGECFGYEPGTLVTGKMTTALKNMGFDAVFDTNFAADLTIMEEGTELLTRLKAALLDKKPIALPMTTSCCPGWIKFAEYYFPDLLPHLSTCRSPQQMFGPVAKTYYASKVGVKAKDMIVVSVMPCTAKKFEIQRPEMNSSGQRDVDYVLTTRELGKMINSCGIDFRNLKDSTMDSPIGMSSGAADIFANTGGVMEAALRTAYEIVTGKELPVDNLHVTAVTGLEGVKEASLIIKGCLPDWSFLEGVELKVAVAHGLANARKIMDKVRAGISNYHFIEIMTCPGGCIGGGGQPRFTTDEIRQARISAIYKEDEGKKLRKSHENPEITQIYREFLKTPLSKKSHHLLHTKYVKRALIGKK